ASACHRVGDLVGLRVGERAAVEQKAPVTDDADDRRLAETKRLRELLLDGAGDARKLRERERAAADTRDRLLDGSAGALGKPLRPRTYGGGRLVQHPQHGNLARR